MSDQQKLDFYLQQMDANAKCGQEKEPEDKAAADSMEPEAKVGPLTTAMRRPYIVDQLLKGLGNWWNCNWWKVALALFGILVVGTALTIVTSGGFLAMLPPIIEALAAIFIGVMAARMDAEVQAYLKAAWGRPNEKPDLEGGARHLAKALAIGSIELLFNVIFKAGSIFKAIKGYVAGWLGKARAWLAKMALSGSRFGKTVTGIAKGVSKVGTGVMKIPKAIGKVVVQKGKYEFQGLKKGFSKGVKSIRELRDRILKVVKVKRIFVVRTGWWFEIWAEVNPYFILFKGKITEVTDAAEIDRLSKLTKGKNIKSLFKGDAAATPPALPQRGDRFLRWNPLERKGAFVKEGSTFHPMRISADEVNGVAANHLSIDAREFIELSSKPKGSSFKGITVLEDAKGGKRYVKGDVRVRMPQTKGDQISRINLEVKDPIKSWDDIDIMQGNPGGSFGNVSEWRINAHVDIN